MTTAENRALIDKYLHGEMDEKELADFKLLLKSDNKLAGELQFQTEILEAIKDDGKRELRQLLNDIHRKQTRTIQLPVYSRSLRAIAAILVLVFLTGGVLVTNYIAGTSPEQSLYSQYFNPDDALFAVRSGATVSSPVDKGMKYYRMKEYSLAIETFKTDPGNLLGKLYTGFSYMQLNQFNKAENEFNAILDDNDNLLVDQAEWYLGLCYLKSGKTDQATEVFKNISTGNTVYNKKALELLTKMGKTN